MAEDTGRFRTAGGWHIELAFPLSKTDQARVDAGGLTQVDADGNRVPVKEPDKPQRDTPPAKVEAPAADKGTAKRKE
jgi:hypothetical protein